MRRGEIWYARIGGAAGSRPVLLLTRNAAYRYRRSVTVAIVTRTVHGFEGEVNVGPAEGLPYECVVNLDEIVTILIASLDRRMGEVSASKMRQVEDALAYTLALPRFQR
jgi:mRNA interferase MazF